MNLKSKVTEIPKVGPKYSQLLKNLEIETVEDLLYHFPFRYDDFSQVKKIREIVPDEVVTVEGMLSPLKNIFTRNGKRITRAKLVDFTGELNIIWFNQHYLARVLKSNLTYIVSGKVSVYDNKPCLLNPELEEKSQRASLNVGRLVPVYSETAGVSSKWLRSRINDVLDLEKDRVLFEDFLPEEIKNKYTLCELNSAVKKIHFPNSNTDADISRRRLAFDEMFLELLKVEGRKSAWTAKTTGFKLRPFGTKVKTFIQGLPFELTDSQKTSIEEIVEDMQKAHPMNRLLEGDVGTGKTIVALVAAYFAHLNGYKTLYMAPTEILADQHFETFSKLLSQSGLKIGKLTGSQKNEGEWDVLIGTHALLYAPENYKDVALVVIDEQHRFGVEQRGKILEMAQNPHLLTMTATPIPRTLALTLYGDMSVSILKTHPNKLRKITTKVVTVNSRDKMYEWIRQKNEPTFVVCPFIEGSENEMLLEVKAAQEEFKTLSEGVFKGVSVGLLHGRMKPAEKKAVVDKFRTGEIKVLVSTPVIEVGIDFPDATVMVIESAERYGLASLHQLRGRVGRGLAEGFCFVCMSSQTRPAFARLKNLEQIDNGLELADLDMRIRGQGDIFGTMQHGEIKFKVASLNDLELLEQAKEAVQSIFPKVKQFPMLSAKLEQSGGDFIKNN